jgi:hypothetical protein
LRIGAHLTTARGGERHHLVQQTGNLSFLPFMSF